MPFISWVTSTYLFQTLKLQQIKAIKRLLYLSPSYFPVLLELFSYSHIEIQHISHYYMDYYLSNVI